MYLSMALRVSHTPEPGLAVPVVSPSGKVDNRVQADAFQGNSKLERLTHFTSDISEPIGAPVRLRAGLSDKHWPAVMLINFKQETA